MAYPLRVLFLCTGNSARSQMAEGLLRWLGKDDFVVFSAGTEPRGLHPLAIEALADVGVDISQQRSKHLSELRDQQFDYIITVCDNARDSCPTLPGDGTRIHWSYPDPAAAEGDTEAQRQAFRKVRAELSERLRLWVLTQRNLLRDQNLLPAGEWFEEKP